MAAPTYTWSYVTNLLGLTNPPSVATLEATTSLETKVGTLVIMSGGQVDTAAGTDVTILGLAASATAVAATAADPTPVYLLRPGDVIKGTADADASALSGFAYKLVDMNTDGSLDVADTSGGSLAVWRTEDAGLTVYCVVSKSALYG
jgi:hypothetical protein